MLASATYRNQVTKSETELSFDLKEGETALEGAWRVLGTAASLAGWNWRDVIVVAAG